MPYIEQDVKAFIEQAGALNWRERLQWVAQQHAAASFSTSFGVEDQLLTDAIATDTLPIAFFTLDTGRLFEETYALYQQTVDRYGIAIRPYYPDLLALEKYVTQHGINGFYESVENRKACCFIRKVEPLQRALSGVDIWVSGLRREQSDNRSNLEVAEWDAQHQLIKFYPLVDVTLDEVEQYIAEHHVPYNSLHNQGYPSIGCAPCTRAIEPGEHPRSGRWWWEQGSAQECGLHVVNGKLVPIKSDKGGIHAH